MSNFPRTLVKGLMAISGRFWPKAATQHLQLQDRMIGWGAVRLRVLWWLAPSPIDGSIFRQSGLLECLFIGYLTKGKANVHAGK